MGYSNKETLQTTKQFIRSEQYLILNKELKEMKQCLSEKKIKSFNSVVKAIPLE